MKEVEKAMAQKMSIKRSTKNSLMGYALSG
jgi:hypothetical protein